MKLINLIFFGLVLAVTVFFANPNFSSAVSREEMIQSLMEQIKVLQAQIIHLQNNSDISSRWCYDFNSNLRIGEKGKGIIALHKALENNGFGSFDRGGDDFNAFEVFTEETASAVVGFQQKYKDEILTPNGLQYGTGFVGKSTRAKLNKIYGCGSYPKSSSSSNSSKSSSSSSNSSLSISSSSSSSSSSSNISSVATTNPSITVLSPNGGETLDFGIKDIDFRTTWNSSNLIGSVSVYVAFADGRACEVGTVSVSAGVYAAKLGQYYSCPNIPSVLVQGNQYKVLLIADSLNSTLELGIRDYSDDFFAIKYDISNNPIITVSAPKGGGS